MRIPPPALALAAILLGLPCAAQAASVRVKIDAVLSDSGMIGVALCTSEQFLGDHCSFKKDVPARAGQTVALFRNVPPGSYAIQVHHDANANGKMDWGMLGLFPAEAYGFSNLSRLYAKPDFEEAAFTVAKRKVSIAVELVNP